MGQMVKYRYGVKIVYTLCELINFAETMLSLVASCRTTRQDTKFTVRVNRTFIYSRGRFPERV
jgi:hypothetical protein